jgi:hypothetical protein
MSSPPILGFIALMMMASFSLSKSTNEENGNTTLLDIDPQHQNIQLRKAI